MAKVRKGPPRVDEDAGPGEVAFQARVAFEAGLPNYRRARQAECGMPQRPADATGSWQTIEVIRGERALPPGNDQPVHDGEGDGRPQLELAGLEGLLELLAQRVDHAHERARFFAATTSVFIGKPFRINRPGSARC
jgi:hypothetical protein